MEYSLIEAKILELEERLMQYDFNELETLLADDFLEYGSSGNVYTKKDQLDAVRNRDTLAATIRFTVTDFKIKLLAPDVVLATYRTYRHDDMKHAFRSSIWKLNEGKWQMVFHQGTLTLPDGKGE